MHKCVRVNLVEASLAEKDREERCDQGFRRPVAGIELAAPPITALETVPTCRLRGWRGSAFLAHGTWTGATKYLFVLLQLLCISHLPLANSLACLETPPITASTRTLSLPRVTSISFYSSWYALDYHESSTTTARPLCLPQESVLHKSSPRSHRGRASHLQHGRISS